MVDATSGKSPWQRMVAGSAVAIAGLLLVSCGGEAVLVSPDTASPSAAGTATLAAAPTVIAATPLPMPPLGDVVWTTAVDPVTSAPTGVVTAISPDAARIIAAVETNALAAGSHLKATWEYNDTSLDAFTTELVSADQTSQRWISFHMTREDVSVPWPEGTYEIAIAVNGSVVRTAAIDVVGQE
jgi:hypothetical protein